jgi:hypothetical protein
MAMRARIIVLIAAAGLLAVTIAVAAWYSSRRHAAPAAPPPPQRQAGTGVRVPAPLPYTFRWREGATRGVDLPTHISVGSLGIVLPLYPVQDMRSDPGEDKIAFLQRVRGTLVRYSDRQTHEACADICSDGTKYSVRITTVASTRYCAVAPICMAGDQSIRESIHSHCPYRWGLTATAADEALSGKVLHAGESLPRCDTEHFSAADFAGRRPTWLAGRRALYEEDGPQRITRYKP